jgi:hypothetical protein
LKDDKKQIKGQPYINTSRDDLSPVSEQIDLTFGGTKSYKDWPRKEAKLPDGTWSISKT